MAVFIGGIGKAKYFVFFGSKKIGGFNTLREAKSYAKEMIEYGYPYLMVNIKHKGKFIE